MTASQVNGMPGAFPPPPPPSVPTAPPQSTVPQSSQMGSTSATSGYGNPYDTFNYQNGQQSTISFDYSNSMPAVSASNVSFIFRQLGHFLKGPKTNLKIQLYSNYLPQMASPLLNNTLENGQQQQQSHNPSSPPSHVLESKQIAKIEEGSGSDSGNDVRSPSSHHDSQTQLNTSGNVNSNSQQSSSASPSNQSAGSSGFGDSNLAPASTPPSTLSVPFFAPYSTTATSTPTSTSSTSNHFYPNQYYPTTLDMVNYQQYTQNIYANQGDF